MKIAIVGASGFVGCKLLRDFSGDFQCVAISRSKPLTDGDFDWRQCDLHNLKELESSLEGCNIAIYLVHSMLASSGLNQGNFQDFDISLADNFARAAKAAGIQRVIYLSGLMPKGAPSPHLGSRLEVETIYRYYFSSLTILRAGIIVGERGSSFNMMYRLARKLPIMLCPSWTKTLSQPVYVDDVVKGIRFCIDNRETLNKIYDLGAPTPTSYESMMTMIGEKSGRKPKIYHFDTFSPQLSSLWLTFITGAPMELTTPLVGSLKDPLLVREKHKMPMQDDFIEFSEALDLILDCDKIDSFKPPHAFRYWIGKQKQKHVRSIQRLTLPKGWNCKNIAKEYTSWLPSFLKHLIRAKVNGGVISFQTPLIPLELLRLKYSEIRSDDTRCLFYIDGGILVSSEAKNGRLEFRILPHKNQALAAIHDFIPSLPWVIYRSTQSVVHNWVMRKFNEHLIGLSKKYEFKEAS